MNSFSLHGNWIDLVFLGLIIYFILNNQGFIIGILEVFGFVVSLFFSYQTFGFVGKLLQSNFSLTAGIAATAGFFISWFILESIIYFLISFLTMRFLKPYQENPLNKRFGFLPGILHAAVLFMFLVNMLFALPVKGQIKQDILDSKSGVYFVNIAQPLQLKIKNVFGGAISEALNFLTIEPGSNENLKLGFHLNKSQLKVDETSERVMLELINKERTQRGLRALESDPELQPVARAYGEQMLENGFFAHVSQVDNTSPADRANRANVEYTVIGENLAFAPDVYLAHQGLMNSPGHRANILSTDYSRVGIGIIDGGVYGRIFVQDFRN